MEDFNTWLEDMSAKPLPGGVAAASMAAAMGSALLAKAVRVSLQRQNLSEQDGGALQAAMEHALHQQVILVSLAEADKRAYSAVMDSRTHGSEKRDAWREATEIPIRIAEACHLLLRQLPKLQEFCWTPVKPDMEVGQWLLEIGVRAGISAAESNLQIWSDDAAFIPLQARVDALKQALDAVLCCPSMARYRTKA